MPDQNSSTLGWLVLTLDLPVLSLAACPVFSALKLILLYACDPSPTQSIQRRLEEIEVTFKELEDKGVVLEQVLRGEEGATPPHPPTHPDAFV